MIDQTDYEILSLLKNNSRLQWKEIGELVHLTGQAVANRIRRMEDMGIIKEYTINIDEKKLGMTVTAFITVFMKTTDHKSFQKFIKSTESISEAHRISGEGCYLLKINVSDQEKLNKVLDSILKYGNYRVNISIEDI